MTQPLLEAQDVRLLMEIGMLGAGAKLSAPVEQLFAGLMVLRPSHDFPSIGQATAFLNPGRAEDAVRVLERGLGVIESTQRPGSEPDRDMVRAFLGLALFMARRTAEATGQLQQLLRGGCHPQALRMARGLLGLPLETPSPQAPQTQEPQTEEVP